MNNKFENFHDIIIELEDINLQKQCTKFINQLETDYAWFLTNIKNEEKKFEEFKEKAYSKNKDWNYLPEKISIKSPLTIIDAPWGTGKTYFIESLIRLWATDEIKTRKIKKIIILDAWKYSSINDVPNELMAELFAIILHDFQKDENKIKAILKGLSLFYNVFARPWLNRFLGTDIPRVEENEKIDLKDLEEAFNKIVEEPILIFFDNVERLEENSWEIMKAIQKLSMLNNMIFVLPMNKKMLDDKSHDGKDGNGEWKIEKYLTLPPYSFKQDYMGVLENHDFIWEDSIIINNLLNHQINGGNLTVRQLQEKIKIYKLREEFDKSKYHGLRTFQKVWNIESKIIDIFTKNINSFIKNKLVNLEKAITEIEGIKNYDKWKTLIQKIEYHKMKTTDYNSEHTHIFENEKKWTFLKDEISNNNNINLPKIFIYEIDEVDKFIFTDEKYFENKIKNEIKFWKKENTEVEERIKKLMDNQNKWEKSLLEKQSDISKLENIAGHEMSDKTIAEINRLKLENETFAKEIDKCKTNIHSLNPKRELLNNIIMNLNQINEGKYFKEIILNIISLLGDYKSHYESIRQDRDLKVFIEILRKIALEENRWNTADELEKLMLEKMLEMY